MSDSLYIIIPAYNEEMNIETIAREWHQAAAATGPDSRLVIINDGSRDETYNKLLALTEELPLLIPLTKENGGHGATCLLYTSPALPPCGNRPCQKHPAGTHRSPGHPRYAAY